MKLNTEKLLLLIVVGLLLCNLFLRRCTTPASPTDMPKFTVVRDTVWQTKTDTFTVQTTAYKTVYVNAENVSEVVEDTTEILDFDTYKEARVYRDTLTNQDVEIFSYNLVEGELLDSKLSYNLKVPREITVTKTIEHPKTFRSGLYVFGETGGNRSSFDNISLGLQYNRKGNWFVSYRINMNQLQQPSHNVGLGVRLFK
ncbi:MAG: hypothetical protein AAF901_04025 [Bacteroidota bacterium]